MVCAFAGAVIGILGASTNPLVLGLLAVLLVLDVGVLLLSRSLLICYRCRTVYDRLPIARYHKGWDPRIAERTAADRDSSQTEEAGQ